MAFFALVLGQAVANANVRHVAALLRDDANISATATWLNAVLDGILNQRLQDERGHLGFVHRRVYVPSHAQAVLKPHLLDRQVVLG